MRYSTAFTLWEGLFNSTKDRPQNHNLHVSCDWLFRLGNFEQQLIVPQSLNLCHLAWKCEKMKKKMNVDVIIYYDLREHVRELFLSMCMVANYFQFPGKMKLQVLLRMVLCLVFYVLGIFHWIRYPFWWFIFWMWIQMWKAQKRENGLFINSHPG